jgi:hypothetical protein
MRVWLGASCSDLILRSAKRLSKDGSDKKEDVKPHSRGMICPGFCEAAPSKNSEGAGNAGRWPHPQPRTQNKEARTSKVTTGWPKHSGTPCAMVYGF